MAILGGVIGRQVPAKMICAGHGNFGGHGCGRGHGHARFGGEGHGLGGSFAEMRCKTM